MCHSCAIHRKGTETNIRQELLDIACDRGSKDCILWAYDYCPGSLLMSTSLFVANPKKLSKEVANEPDSGVVFWITHCIARALLWSDASAIIPPSRLAVTCCRARCERISATT
jgi:hypothetical protein